MAISRKQEFSFFGLELVETQTVYFKDEKWPYLIVMWSVKAFPDKYLVEDGQYGSIWETSFNQALETLRRSLSTRAITEWFTKKEGL